MVTVISSNPCWACVLTEASRFAIWPYAVVMLMYSRSMSLACHHMGKWVFLNYYVAFLGKYI